MSAAGAPAAGGSVLVVEDEEAIRLLVARVLTKAGYAVTQARDGRVALEKLQTTHFDAIVLDLMMPHVDGFGVIDFIREHVHGRRCIVVTTAAAPSTAARVDQEVVHTTLSKPFELTDLVAAVRRCVGG